MTNDEFTAFLERVKRHVPRIRAHIIRQGRGMEAGAAVEARNALLNDWFYDLRDVRAEDAGDALKIHLSGGKLLWPDSWMGHILKTALLVRLKRQDEENRAKRDKAIGARCEASGGEDHIPEDWQRGVDRVAALKGPKPMEYRRRVGVLRKYYGKGKSPALAWQLEQLGEPVE